MADAVFELQRGPAPIAPPVVSPRWQTMMSAPASAMAVASSALNT